MILQHGLNGSRLGDGERLTKREVAGQNTRRQRQLHTALVKNSPEGARAMVQIRAQARMGDFVRRAIGEHQRWNLHSEKQR